MKDMIVFDHPYTIKASQNVPHFRSYAAAIAQTCIDTLTAKGDEVDLIDLHADNFDPVMHQDELNHWRLRQPVNAQCEAYYARLAAADRIFFIFTIWWEVMPAMMKGFIDKVLSKNHYNAKGRPRVLPKNPQIEVLTDSATPTPLYRLIFGSPVNKALKGGTFNKLGLRHYAWQNFVPEHQSAKKRQAALAKLSQRL